MGTNLFKSFDHPRAPATATFVNETQGREPMLSLGGSSNPMYEIPRVQIIDRSSDYETARNNSEFIYRVFLDTGNQTLLPVAGADGTRYLTLSPLQSPFRFSQDESGRHLISFNAEVMKSIST